MSYYSVSGEIEGTEMCDCPHCEGHEAEGLTVVRVAVNAHDEDEAADQVLDAMCFLRYDDYDWVEDTLVVERLAEDQVMRLLGQPELPLEVAA